MLTNTKTKWFHMADYERKKVLSQVGDLAMIDDRFLEEIQQVLQQYTIKWKGKLPSYSFEGGPQIISNEQK